MPFEAYTRIILPGLEALCVTALLIWILLASRLARKVLDLPNDRSMHTRPTSRLGGICVMIAAIGIAFTEGGLSLWPVLGLATALAFLSLLDDIRGLPVSVRLGLHLLVAALFLWAYPPGWLLGVPLVFAIVWVINLYNFMDGIDGLAGGMAAIGFSAYAAAALAAGANPLAIFCCCLVGAAIGFLFFNFSPAKIFMGDSGAIPFGFLAAGLGYFGFAKGLWPWWFPLFVFSPFLLDATLTLARRLSRGKKVWQAHRTHYYQRMASVLGHRRTALYWYATMLVAAGCGYSTRNTAPTVTALWALCLGAGLVMAMFWIDRKRPVVE